MNRETEMARIDKRRLRAQPLLHLIMEKIRPHLRDDRDLRFIHYEIWDALHAAGAEVITDDIRAQAGLPPRGTDGWTLEEIAALDRRMFELVNRPAFSPLQFISDNPVAER